MRRFISVLVSVVLLCSVFPVANADSLIGSNAATDSAVFYTIGNSENTLSGVYKRMHIYLNLNKYPIPEPEETDYEYKTGHHEEFTVLKNDEESYDYIGYVCSSSGKRVYIIWSWTGFHKDGSLVGVDTYYTLDGTYLGNVQRDYTNSAALSSRNSPFTFNFGSLKGKK